MLHLDVAPSNIIVDKDGKGVLVDASSANLMLHPHQAVCVFPVFDYAGELESLLYTVLH